MSQTSLYELIDDLLVLINGKLDLKSLKVSIKDIMQANDGIIRSYFSQRDIEFALEHLCEEESLSKTKIMKSIALKMLHEKTDGFRLKEYVCALKAAYELAIPSIVLNDD